MKIPFPHSSHPVTRLIVRAPGLEVTADADHSTEFFECELPEGMPEDQPGIMACYLNNGGQMVEGFIVQEGYPNPEPKTDEKPLVEGVNEDGSTEPLDVDIDVEATLDDLDAEELDEELDEEDAEELDEEDAEELDEEDAEELDEEDAE